MKQENSGFNQNHFRRNLTGLTDLVGFEAIPTKLGRNLPGFMPQASLWENLLGFYLSPNNQKYLPKLFLQFTENCFYFRMPIFVHQNYNF